MDPLKISLQNDEILYTVQPPGGGAVLGLIMSILRGYNFTERSVADVNSTILTYHRILEAFKIAYGKNTELRDLNLLDGSELFKNMTSESYGESFRMKINDSGSFEDIEHINQTHDSSFFGKDEHGTSHISVIAPNGDAVSVTSSLDLK